MKCLKIQFSIIGKGVFKHFVFLFFIFCFTSNAQNLQNWFVDANYYTGAILPHSDQISHLITKKPTGYLVSFNRKTSGDKPWESFYNYPDYGFSLHYQDNHNTELGNLYGVFAHYNFYFLKRNLQFRVAQGIAYATNPYNKETNFRNMAYGTQFMPSTYFSLNYNKKNFWNGVGFQTGFLFIHHSNATIKSPNTSTNTVALQLGFNYSFDKQEQVRKFSSEPDNFQQQLQYGFSFKTGVNESHIIGMGQKPFYHINGYVEKRLNRTGGVQLGAELFLSQTLKELIPFLAVSFPETNIKADADYKRVGAFVGYELYINKLSAEAQLGYYLHDEYKENGSLYQRLGMKYYVTEKVFGSMTLKTHYGKAEALEFGVGIKL